MWERTFLSCLYLVLCDFVPIIVFSLLTTKTKIVLISGHGTTYRFVSKASVKKQLISPEIIIKKWK